MLRLNDSFDLLKSKSTKMDDSATPMQKKRGRVADMDPKVLKKRLKQMFLSVKNFQVRMALICFRCYTILAKLKDVAVEKGFYQYSNCCFESVIINIYI